MSDHNATMYTLLLELAGSGKDVQVRLRGDFSPTPLGPGKIEHHRAVAGIFRITCEAVQHTPTSVGGHIKTTVMLPFLFVADDVLWISEPPVPKEASDDKTSSIYLGGS